MLWRGEISGEKSRFHPSSFALGFESFFRLEIYRLRTGVSWYEAKLAILQEAIRAYLANPLYVLYPTA